MLKEKMQSEPEIENTRNADKESSSLKSGVSTKINLPPGWTRTTITIREEHLQKIKDLAHLAKIRKREALEIILEDFFSKHKIPCPNANRMELLKLVLENLSSKTEEDS